MIKSLLIVLILVCIELVPIHTNLILDMGLVGIFIVAAVSGTTPWLLAILLGVLNDLLTGAWLGSFGLVYVFSLVCYQTFPINLYLTFRNILHMLLVFSTSASFMFTLVYFNFNLNGLYVILEFFGNHLAIWTFLAIIVSLVHAAREMIAARQFIIK